MAAILAPSPAMSPANPIQYAADHLNHVLAAWEGNREYVSDGQFRPLPLHFRDSFRSLTLAAHQGTDLEGLDPSFWIGFLADKNRIEDTGACEHSGRLASSLIHEIGYFNVPAGPSIVCENEQARRFFYGTASLGESDDSDESWNASSLSRQERLFDENRATLCRLEAQRESDRRAGRPIRNVSVNGCVNTLAPYQGTSRPGENLYSSLAQDARVFNALTRGVRRMTNANGGVDIDLSPDGWRTATRSNIEEQLAIGIVSLHHYARETMNRLPRTHPRLFVPERHAGEPRLSDRDLGWMATLGLLGWTAGSGDAARFVDRFSESLIVARATPDQPLWPAWMKGVCQTVMQRCRRDLERAMMTPQSSGLREQNREVQCSHFRQINKHHFTYRLLRVAQRLETTREVAMHDHNGEMLGFLNRAVGTREQLRRSYEILTRAAIGLHFHARNRGDLSCE